MKSCHHEAYLFFFSSHHRCRHIQIKCSFDVRSSTSRWIHYWGMDRVVWTWIEEGYSR